MPKTPKMPKLFIKFYQTLAPTPARPRFLSPFRPFWDLPFVTILGPFGSIFRSLKTILEHCDKLRPLFDECVWDDPRLARPWFLSPSLTGGEASHVKVHRQHPGMKSGKEKANSDFPSFEHRTMTAVRAVKCSSSGVGGTVSESSWFRMQPPQSSCTHQTSFLRCAASQQRLWNFVTLTPLPVSLLARSCHREERATSGVVSLGGVDWLAPK